MSYQSELVHFLTGHAFGVDDDVTERAPNRVLSGGSFFVSTNGSFFVSPIQKPLNSRDGTVESLWMECANEVIRR